MTLKRFDLLALQREVQFDSVVWVPTRKRPSRKTVDQGLGAWIAKGGTRRRALVRGQNRPNGADSEHGLGRRGTHLDLQRHNELRSSRMPFATDRAPVHGHEANDSRAAEEDVLLIDLWHACSLARESVDPPWVFLISDDGEIIGELRAPFQLLLEASGTADNGIVRPVAWTAPVPR